MSSKTHTTDPALEPPPTLLNRDNVGQLAKDIAGATVPQIDDEEEALTLESLNCDPPEIYKPPKRLMRTCLASLDNSDTFGQLMQAEAHRKGFFRAKRKAFVADGMKCNWSIQKSRFPDFIPIVDFIYAVSHLYQAAVAIGEDEDFGWGLCAEWIRALWQGRVRDVIEELDEWLASQPKAPKDLADDDPREVVRVSRGYLNNNQTRMNYPAYRKQGLPLTSTLMESPPKKKMFKEMNYRVKGSEKFWNNPQGANHILAIKSAALSEDGRLYTKI